MSKGLLEAAKKDSISGVQSLVDSSDLSMKDDGGNNVLHLLFAREHPIFIKGFLSNDSYIVSHILTKEGVDKTKLMEPNEQGFTPLDILLKSKCRDGTHFAEIDHTAKLDLIATLVEHGADFNADQGETDLLSQKYLNFIKPDSTENDVDFVRYEKAGYKYSARNWVKLLFEVVTITLSMSLILVVGGFTGGALLMIIPSVIVGCERFSNSCAELLTRVDLEDAYAYEAKIRADKTLEVLKLKGKKPGKASDQVVDEGQPRLGQIGTTDSPPGIPTSDVQSGVCSTDTANMYKIIFR